VIVFCLVFTCKNKQTEIFLKKFNRNQTKPKERREKCCKWCMDTTRCTEHDELLHGISNDARQQCYFCLWRWAFLSLLGFLFVWINRLGVACRSLGGVAGLLDWRLKICQQEWILILFKLSYRRWRLILFVWSNLGVGAWECDLCRERLVCWG